MVTLMLFIGSTWNLVIILKCASRWPQTQLCTPVLQHRFLLFFKLIHQASAAMNLMLTPCPALPPSLIPEVVHLLCVFLNALLDLAYPSSLSLLHPSLLFPLLFPSSLPTYLLPSLSLPPPPPPPSSVCQFGPELTYWYICIFSDTDIINNIVDLHGLKVKEALKVVKEHLNTAKNNDCKWIIVLLVTY